MLAAISIRAELEISLFRFPEAKTNPALMHLLSAKAEYRINGIDPENHWTLQCSFQTKDAAVTQCDELSEIHATVCGIFDNYQTQTYRVRDIGAEMTFEIQGGLF